MPIPLQVPEVPLSTTPRRAVPVIVGRPVLTGSAVGTVADAALLAASVPSGLVAVTSRRTIEPTSATVRS